MSSLDLRQINPVEIHSVWDQVKEGLKVIKDYPGCEGWLPEDVYHAIKSGISYLYMGYSEGLYCGFLVLSPQREPYTNNLKLHVWLAYSVNKDIYQEAEEQVKRMARDIGAKKITFGSTRTGWMKRYKINNIVYEVSL